MQREILAEGLKALNIPPSEPIVRAFEVYSNELLRWNSAYNLTAIKDERDIINKHFLDSLLYTICLPENPCTLCDVGSGAGFPGLPIAIVRRDITVTLVEASRKKAAFLYHIRQKLALKTVEVLNKRIEDIGDKTFDVITTRALFSPEELIKKTAGLLSAKGMLLLSLGKRAPEKIEDNLVQFNQDNINTLIPNTSIKRILITLKAVS